MLAFLLGGDNLSSFPKQSVFTLLWCSYFATKYEDLLLVGKKIPPNHVRYKNLTPHVTY